VASEHQPGALRRYSPGAMWPWIKLASYFELALFTGLLIVWIAPGLEGPTFAFGLAHGLGFVALALLIAVAALRNEAPYTLLAATMTPVGPVGSVIALEYLERNDPGLADGPGDPVDTEGSDASE
jgi:hypothetical protein